MVLVQFLCSKVFAHAPLLGSAGDSTHEKGEESRGVPWRPAINFFFFFLATPFKTTAQDI